MLENLKLHFIGVGGVGVNALARFALDLGARVSGSDAKINSLCKNLIAGGAQIFEGTDASRVDGADTVVFSSAIKPDNAELARARELKIPTLERHVFLGEVASRYSKVVGIAGTHGKTTTTAMLTHILAACGHSFVSMIGGECVDFGNYVNNSRGDDDMFVTEACEYRRSFLSLKPTVAVVTNVECDHPDCYKDIDEVRGAFDAYLGGAQTKIYSDGVDGYKIFVENADGLRTYEIKIEDGCRRLFVDGACIGNIVLPPSGDYDFKNAAFAIAAAASVGVSVERALCALASFRGVKRRFEYAGDVGGVPIYFDFAHHPTEIRCVLERAKAYGKILAVFQPHTYSRTKAYFDDFVSVLGEGSDIGTLVVMPTYAARENPCEGYNSAKLAREIARRYGKTDVVLADGASDTVDIVKAHAPEHNVILFIGAGDIYELRSQFAKNAE